MTIASKFDDTIGKYRRMLTAQTSAVKLPRYVSYLSIFSHLVPFVDSQIIGDIQFQPFRCTALFPPHDSPR